MEAAIPVVAVDIPSGAEADAMGPQKGTIARANSIVTFTAPRLAHLFGALTDGATYVAGIGSPDEAIVSSLKLNVITPRDFAAFVARRPADSNKGNYGHVLVIGGAVGQGGIGGDGRHLRVASGRGIGLGGDCEVRVTDCRGISS